jgi:hypothetical protein
VRNEPKENKPLGSYSFNYDKTLNAMVLVIVDSEGMFPFYLRDNESDLYKIMKTSKGKLQMIK